MFPMEGSNAEQLGRVLRATEKFPGPMRAIAQWIRAVRAIEDAPAALRQIDGEYRTLNEKHGTRLVMTLTSAQHKETTGWRVTGPDTPEQDVRAMVWGSLNHALGNLLRQTTDDHERKTILANVYHQLAAIKPPEPEPIRNVEEPTR